MRSYAVKLIIVGVLLILSCGRENKVQVKELDESEFWIDLPDSINLDSTVHGLIKYKVSDSPLNEMAIHKQYTFLYATLSEKKIHSFEDLKEMPHDTFAVIEENLIPIYDMKISGNSKSNVDFQGFLVQQFFYSINSDSMRIITKERRFKKTIKVN